MAGDRIYLNCDYCGDCKMMVKHFAGDSSTRDNGLIKWINLHARCHPAINNNDLGGIPGFSVSTESAEVQ